MSEKLITMLSSIRRLTVTELPGGNLGEHLDEISEFTGWYALNRLGAEGPYESIIFNENDHAFEPTEGPLAGTKTQWPLLWCAVSEGRLQVADKKGTTQPPAYEDYVEMRGWYDLDPKSNKVVWHPIGEPWDENEIGEYKVLSNISYRLYRKVPTNPRNILFFGAGASYGSDRIDLHKKNLLPPLGNQLFLRLRTDDELKYWRKLPREMEDRFTNGSFEEAMEALGEIEDEKKYARARDLELSLFMGKYRPGPSNLYRKLAFRISHNLRTNAWSGAIITLNYECLLEESLRNENVFPAVKGVTEYDINVELQLPDDNQLLEICYPHGACHFFLGQNVFVGFEEGLIFGEKGGVAGNVGAGHILHPPSIRKAVEKNYHPLIRRYQPSKRPSVNNYFMDTQIDRSKELILSSKKVTIIGVQCLVQNDRHIWEPLAETPGFILYVEPLEDGQNQFRSWAKACGKIEGRDFRIDGRKFKDAFVDILEFNDL